MNENGIPKFPKHRHEAEALYKVAGAIANETGKPVQMPGETLNRPNETFYMAPGQTQTDKDANKGTLVEAGFIRQQLEKQGVDFSSPIVLDEQVWNQFWENNQKHLADMSDDEVELEASDDAIDIIRSDEPAEILSSKLVTREERELSDALQDGREYGIAQRESGLFVATEKIDEDARRRDNEALKQATEMVLHSRQGVYVPQETSSDVTLVYEKDTVSARPATKADAAGKTESVLSLEDAIESHTYNPQAKPKPLKKGSLKNLDHKDIERWAAIIAQYSNASVLVEYEGQQGENDKLFMPANGQLFLVDHVSDQEREEAKRGKNVVNLEKAITDIRYNPALYFKPKLVEGSETDEPIRTTEQGLRALDTISHPSPGDPRGNDASFEYPDYSWVGLKFPSWLLRQIPKVGPALNSGFKTVLTRPVWEHKVTRDDWKKYCQPLELVTHMRNVEMMRRLSAQSRHAVDDAENIEPVSLYGLLTKVKVAFPTKADKDAEKLFSKETGQDLNKVFYAQTGVNINDITAITYRFQKGMPGRDIFYSMKLFPGWRQNYALRKAVEYVPKAHYVVNWMTLGLLNVFTRSEPAIRSSNLLEILADDYHKDTIQVGVHSKHVSWIEKSFTPWGAAVAAGAAYGVYATWKHGVPLLEWAINKLAQEEKDTENAGDQIFNPDRLEHRAQEIEEYINNLEVEDQIKPELRQALEQIARDLRHIEENEGELGQQILQWQATDLSTGAGEYLSESAREVVEYAGELTGLSPIIRTARENVRNITDRSALEAARTVIDETTYNRLDRALDHGHSLEQAIAVMTAREDELEERVQMTRDEAHTWCMQNYQRFIGDMREVLREQVDLQHLADLYGEAVTKSMEAYEQGHDAEGKRILEEALQDVKNDEELQQALDQYRHERSENAEHARMYLTQLDAVTEQILKDGATFGDLREASDDLAEIKDGLLSFRDIAPENYTMHLEQLEQKLKEEQTVNDQQYATARHELKGRIEQSRIKQPSEPDLDAKWYANMGGYIATGLIVAGAIYLIHKHRK